MPEELRFNEKRFICPHVHVACVPPTKIPWHTKDNNGSARGKGLREGTPRRSRVLSRRNERMCTARNGARRDKNVSSIFPLAWNVASYAGHYTPYARAFLSAPTD